MKIEYTIRLSRSPSFKWEAKAYVDGRITIAFGNTKRAARRRLLHKVMDRLDDRSERGHFEIEVR